MSFVVQNNYGVSSSGLRNKKKEAQNMSFFGNTKNFLTIIPTILPSGFHAVSSSQLPDADDRNQPVFHSKQERYVGLGLPRTDNYKVGIEIARLLEACSKYPLIPC